MFRGLIMAGARQMALANQAEMEGKRAAREAAEVRAQNEALSYNVEKLFMITEILWSMLKEKHGYTDEDLAQMMKEAELHSVKQTEQGEGAEATVKCAECGRTLTKRQPRCLYCGAEAPLQPFER